MKRKIFTSLSVVLAIIFLGSFVSDNDEINKGKTKKNVILLIGDGMGLTHLYAGMTANHGKLSIERITHMGAQKTYSANNYTTDSAASGTAIATGTKTNNGVVGMDTSGAVVHSILEYAEENDFATGLISTSAITHATPASFISHVPNRGLYEDIAADFLKTDIDVFIGGGANHFMNRKDSVNLADKLKDNGYKVLFDMNEISKVKSGKLAGFAAPDHCPPYLEGRGDMLSEATATSIKILRKNKKGFFLMVEGSQIDWGGHANNTDYVVSEVIDFDNAIKVALDFAEKDGNTLVIVTADHETGGMSILGGDFKEGTVKASYGTTGHTGVLIPVYAFGPGAEEFSGIYENTDIFLKLMEFYGFKKSK